MGVLVAEIQLCKSVPIGAGSKLPSKHRCKHDRKGHRGEHGKLSRVIPNTIGEGVARIRLAVAHSR